MLILEDSRTQKIHTLAFSPDGRTLASVNGRSTAIKLWDIDGRRVRNELTGCRNRVTAVAFSPDGERFASAAPTGQVQVWTLSPPRPFREVKWQRVVAQAPAQVVFSPDSEWLATNIEGVTNHHIHWLNHHSVQLVGRDGSRRCRRTEHRNEISCLAYSPDGRFLATGSFDRTVHIDDVDFDRNVFHLNLGQKVHYLAFSPDGSTLASGSPGGLVKVWDAETGKKRNTLKGQAKPLHALCYSPDGRTIATAGGEGTVAFWDVAAGRSRLALDWGVGEVHAVAFAPDGMRAAAGGVGKIVVWDIDDWDV